MAKRFAIAFFVVVGASILLVAAFLLLLFLAPGFSIFGLRYIAQGTHVVKLNEVQFVDIQGIGNTFNGTIKIKTSQIPVEIRFIPTYERVDGMSIYYIDNYNGLTLSNIEEPSVEVTKDNSGAIVISTTEFERFIFQTSSTERLLRVSIPMGYISSGDNRPDLVIDAGSAGIKFYDQEADERIPSFENINIKTAGAIEFAREIQALSTYTVETGNSIEIPSSTNTVSAQNYNLTSLNGNITVNRDVPQDLTAKTGRGNITFVSCKNIIATTGDGDVTGKGEEPMVRGLVNITTRAGDVNVGKVDGDGESIVSTGSGNVSITSAKTISITTTRGKVVMNNVDSATVKTNIGKVVINEVLGNCNIETKRGNVYLGGDGLTVKDATVFSRLGKIFMYSAVGTTKLQTISSNIYFENKNLGDAEAVTTIDCGGKLVGKKLSGKFDIKAANDIDLEFDVINNDVNIELADSVRQAKITAIKNTSLDTRFYLKGTYVARYERSGNGQFSKVSEGNEITSGPAISGSLLRVVGKNVSIDVYFNSTI